MDKKKAVKLATASAVAASAFVAANPHASQAATDVATVVSQAKAQFKEAYYTYSHTVTETGKLPNISDVYAAYNKAKQAYANAVAVVNKAGGAKKDAYLADLQATYETYVFKANPKSGEARVATYIDAYNYAVKLDGLRQDLAKAVEAKDLKKAEELYHKISYELKTRTVILDRVYGQSTRDLLRSQFKAEAQKLRDSLVYDITVSMKAREAQDAVKAGNLDKAKAALDQVNQYVSKVTDAFKTELQKAAQDANAAYEAALPFKVESVAVVNAKQIEIKFNKAVDRSTASNKNNYKIQKSSDSSASTLATLDGSADISWSDDGKTVTITTTSGIINKFGVVNDAPFKFIVENIKDKYGKTVDSYSTNLVVKDTVAPTLKEVKATAKSTTTKVTLVFSEPVQASGAIAYVGGQAASVQDGSNPNEIILTTAQALEAGKTYDLTLLNFKDYANNFLQPNPTTKSFTVSSDAVAPTVQDVKVVRDNLIEVTFDKAMDASTFAGYTRVLDLNGNPQGGTITATIKSGTAGKTVRLALGSAVPFNDSGVFSGTLVLGNGIKDVNGNAKSATTHSITLTKDTARPTVAGASYVAAGGQYAGNTYTNGAIVLKFNEDVAKIGSDFRLITAGGEDVTSRLNAGGAAVNNDDNTEVIIPLSSSLSAGTYTLRVGNDVVQDLSTQANRNAAAVTTVTVGASSDSSKPVVNEGSVSAVAATSQTSGTTISLTMTDNVGLDLATVQDVNNYLLNGKPLPSGSYVTIAHGSGSSSSAATNITVTLNIPAKSITKDGQYALNINNIKDKAGNIADPKVANVRLNDDVSPELKTATISSNGLLVLGFSESVNSVGATTPSDFQFVINGVEVATTYNGNIVQFNDGTGTDAGKYVVTFKAKVDKGADNNESTTADNRLYLDVNGNNAFDSGTDILVQTGTTKAVGDVTLDVNLLSALKVKVVNNAAVKDQSTLQNPIQVGTTITVK
ncbi:Ig-like domain-containing protein [Geobacillus thermoleovorans]|uniref:S-layer homology domain-containing protein n=1 Tax=Geobacillus thermoleovorans TaxID=33941 RepID=A0A2Z3N9R9_GEOTH|nr:Ig-like domain-containing protein [Geobacillus thermoleovorans]AWO74674.1 S-layer homology domain-containing protein [Geobacillus thermoleovorans]MBW7642817.1 Ig-like domain-containing protein [Geobacillus thermoleovorans]